MLRVIADEVSNLGALAELVALNATLLGYIDISSCAKSVAREVNLI